MMIGASADSVMMVEGEMDEVSEEEMADAIKFAHEAIKVQCAAQLKLAEAFDIYALKVTNKTQVKPAILDAIKHDGPVLIDFIVESEENVYPFIPSGATVQDMMEEPSSQEIKQ
jgi:thiamine pyrophosphate-dependent acetolactate synthase large subunit-like protein